MLASLFGGSPGQGQGLVEKRAQKILTQVWSRGESLSPAMSAYTSEARSRVTPLCEANSERDMVAVFTPGGKGRLLVTEEIDIRWAQGKQQRGMPLITPLISMITSWVLRQVSRNVNPVSRV